MGKDFEYTGVQVLEAVSYAKNYNNSLLKLVTDNVHDAKKSVVVDFGSGSGMYARMLRDEHAITPICVELDKQLRENTKKDGFKAYKTLGELPQKADVVYSLNVFEHIEDDAAIAKEIYKNLKKDGRLVVYVPAFMVLYSSMDRVVEHYRRYQLDDLKRILEDAGFEIEKIQYADPVGFFGALAYKLVGSKNGVVSPASVKIFDRFFFPVSALLQPATAKLFGKNVYAIARKRS